MMSSCAKPGRKGVKTYNFPLPLPSGGISMSFRSS